MLTSAAILAALVWATLVALPWRPWSTREVLEVGEVDDGVDLRDVTVLVPARDEVECIARTLTALVAQGDLGAIIVIDDQSSDGTAAQALRYGCTELIHGAPLPEGWSGKLWALEQGLRRVSTPLVLLLDADIELAPGTLRALGARLEREQLTLVSVMASLHMTSAWEKLLLPPFIYFFKLLYPFALANRPGSPIAAAAGGCILLRTEALRALGGFGALRGALIDDCTLARLVKRRGGRIWIGLSHAVRAIRPYGSLTNIWNMVARTAFTQLGYSISLLVVCTAMLLLCFAVPLAAFLAGDSAAQAAGVVALLLMATTFAPTVRYFALAPRWITTLPFAALLYLGMTWTSAARYWRGERSRWKNRSYARGRAT